MMARTSWYRREAERFASAPDFDSIERVTSAIDESDLPKTRSALPAQQRIVKAGKTTAAYNAHSYPTKIPPEAIEPYLRRYTLPGQTVLDPFCGSGMTGLAAIRTGRRAVLNDLSPLAVHLAFNHTHACDPDALKAAWDRIRESLDSEESRHYSIRCSDCRGRGRLRYTIWSDVYRCPNCRTQLTLWDATDRRSGRVPRDLTCAGCGHSWPKSARTRVRVDPVWVAYTCTCRRGVRQRALTIAERRRASRFSPPPSRLFVPSAVIDTDREMYQRSALHLRGVRTVADLYTARNLSALAWLWDAIGRIDDARTRSALAFAFTNTAWHGTRMRRFNARGGHRPLTGTLYIPQLSAEANIFEVFDHKIRQLIRFFSSFARNLRASARSSDVIVHRGSAAALHWIPNESIDYVFTDPPFGSNIFYADCNIVAEAWLGSVTDSTLEAVVNRSRRADQGGKSLSEYEGILQDAFAEIRRVLKPTGRATVVFQSSDGAVWNAIERAATTAGFTLESVDILDKVQQSMKGYKGRSGAENVASFDIVLQLRASYKRTASRQLVTNSTRRVLIETIAQHLTVLSPDDVEGRTLPFLYSLSIRTLLDHGTELASFSMDRLRELLHPSFENREGRWYAASELVATG